MPVSRKCFSTLPRQYNAPFRHADKRIWGLVFNFELQITNFECGDDADCWQLIVQMLTAIPSPQSLAEKKKLPTIVIG